MRFMYHLLFLCLISVVIFGFSFSAGAQDSGFRPLPDFLLPVEKDAPPLAPANQEDPSSADLLLDSLDTAPEAPAPDKDDLKDIPDEYIEEALAFGDECAANPQMQLYYDCRCMAVQYLDKRIAAGPDVDATSIRLGLGPKCADGTGIAGRMFERCKDSYTQTPKGKDPEEFCACYGNTYARLFENFGRELRSRQHVNLMAQSRMACTDVDRARRIYGNNPLFPKKEDN